jgi:F-type H+-transporting ATPase subunit b
VLIDWFTVLAQIVNFVILIFLLKRFLYGPIVRAMEARQKKIAEAMERAGRAEEDAGRQSEELAKEKRALLEAKERLMAEARRGVETWREKTVNEAKLEVDKLRQAWVDRLNQDRSVFYQQLKRRVASQVIRIGEKVLQDLANEDLERQVIRVLTERLDRERDGSEPELMRGEVVVRSGLKLDEDAAKMLRDELTKRFPDVAEIKIQEAEDLGIGIEILSGDRKVAWNLETYLQGLEKEILSDLYMTGQERA